MTTVPLGKLVDDITVGWVGPMADEYVPDGIPFLRTLNVQPYMISTEDLKYITPEFHERISKSALRPGDVVVARTGRPGTASVVPDWLDDANCSDLVVIRPGRRVDPRFLVYFLNSKTGRDLVHARKVGSVQSHFNIGSAKKLPIPSTSLDEQRRIAAVLGALDDKIELSRKMNRTLEEMAQALFKSWFIDFDGHDNLVDSELGSIPRGWEVLSLDAVAHFLNGAACQKFRPEGDEPTLPVIKIRELNQGITERTDQARLSIPVKWHVRDGDVLFSWSGSLVVKVWTGGPGALNQHLFKVTSERFPRWFFLLWVGHHLSEFQRIAAAKATTMGHIKRRHLTDAKCAVPPSDALREMGRAIEPLIDRQVQNDLESRTLAALRDTLLPKLISGELRVPEAEATVEAAT